MPLLTSCEGARSAVMGLNPPSPGDVPDLKGLGATVSVGLARRRSWVWRIPGICLLAAVLASPAGMAGGIDREASPATQVQRAVVTAAAAGVHSQTITFSQPPDVPVGTPLTLVASADSGLPVSFTSDSPPVCTVSGLSVTTMAVGVCTITASQGGSADFAAAPDVTRSFQVRA